MIASQSKLMEVLVQSKYSVLLRDIVYVSFTTRAPGEAEEPAPVVDEEPAPVVTNPPTGNASVALAPERSSGKNKALPVLHTDSAIDVRITLNYM